VTANHARIFSDSVQDEATSHRISETVKELMLLWITNRKLHKPF